MSGKFKIEAKTDASKALQLAGQIIPEVGCILSAIGSGLEVKNEQDIR